MSDILIVFLFGCMVLGPSFVAMHTNTRPELEEVI